MTSTPVIGIIFLKINSKRRQQPWVSRETCEIILDCRREDIEPV